MILVVRGDFVEKRQFFTAAIVTPQKWLFGVSQTTLSTLPDDATLASTVTVPDRFEARKTAGYSGIDIDTANRSAPGEGVPWMDNSIAVAATMATS